MDSATEIVKHIRAQEGPQRAILQTRAEVAGYGGSAFGGKTWALLYDPLKHVHDPKFRGVIFRKTCPQIEVAGGLWDESMEWYPQQGGKPFRGDFRWRFPSGAEIRFHHLEEEKTKYNWQGSQVPYFGFDELTHFSESTFTYVAFSRGRTNCTVQPYVRTTFNPDPGWVKAFFAPWVDDQYDGYRPQFGEILWFTRVDGRMVFTREQTEDSKSITFIRARATDNQIGMARNPRYIPSLKALPPIERARLLDGDWNIRREGQVYDFEHCIVDSAPDKSPECGGIDFGYNNPFAAIYGFLDSDDVLWITNVRYVRQVTLPVHSEAIPKGCEWYADPSEPGLIKELRDRGHNVRPCVHIPVRGASGEIKKPILDGIDKVADRMRTNRLRIVRRDCLPLIRELGLYHYDPTKQQDTPVKEDDHACDALRYLVVGLDRNRRNQGWADEEVMRKAEEYAKANDLEEKKRKEAADLAAQSNFDDERWWQ